MKEVTILLIGTVGAAVGFFVAGGITGASLFRTTYQAKPYCITDTATLAEKPFEHTRCWRVFETDRQGQPLPEAP